MNNKIQWHPGFTAAIQMELKHNWHHLTFEEEHNLSKKPLQIDLLVIKKKQDVAIENKIGAMFQRYNLIEYKSPNDEMGIDVFYKVIAYACLYKVSADTENNYKAEDITITLIRQRYPRTLVNYLKQQGFTVEKRFPGIYYVTGNILFAMQLIVSKQLESNEHIWLHSLQNNISQEDYQQLLLHVDTLDAKEKETYGEAILEVVSKANTKQIEKWKEESSMTCPTLERIMEPELEAKRLEGERAGRLQGLLEGERTGRLQGRLEGRILAYAEIGLSVAEIAAKYSLSEEEVADIILRNEE